MTQEVVESFLNLPGITGLALIDGRSRPYFCGVDRLLNSQQKQMFAQGIQQVVSSTPEDFECFEFHFDSHQVYIYKLDGNLVLLVLTVPDLVRSDYDRVLTQLKRELQQDAANLLTTFQLMGCGSLTGRNQTVVRVASPAPTPSSPPASPDRPSSITALPTPEPSDRPTPAEPAPGPPVLMKELLAAMNHLSRFATQYLGPTVVTNYWKSTCPSDRWLQNFRIERSAQIFCADPSSTLTPEQHRMVQTWSQAFVHKCSTILRNFEQTVDQKALTDHQKALLLGQSQSESSPSN